MINNAIARGGRPTEAKVRKYIQTCNAVLRRNLFIILKGCFPLLAMQLLFASKIITVVTSLKNIKNS